MKKAFTLAEIMIVLTVIGILTAILLPVAFNSAPNEDVMKFKKGDSTFATVIRELVRSDMYYKDGDLGKKANGSMVDSSNINNYKYFCETFADVVSAKKVNCQTIGTNMNGYGRILANSTQQERGWETTWFDTECAAVQSKMSAEIVTSDGISYFQINPRMPFGINGTAGASVYCSAYPGDATYAARQNASGMCGSGYVDNSRFFDASDQGFNIRYKIFCMDIDELNKGEAPFGYGVRIDGKIEMGSRAKEWNAKEIQGRQ